MRNNYILFSSPTDSKLEPSEIHGWVAVVHPLPPLPHSAVGGVELPTKFSKMRGGGSLTGS